MPYYLSRYVRGPARGKRDTMVRCVPRGWEQAQRYKHLDLRADNGATLEGNGLNACLFYAAEPIQTTGLTLLGIDHLEPASQLMRTLLAATFRTPELRGETLEAVLLDLVCSLPANSSGRWMPDRTGFVPFSHGPLQRGLRREGEENPYRVLHEETIARDFRRPSMRPKLLRWFGASALMAAMTYWKVWEAFPLLGMALPATDNFTAADTTDLPVYSANWTYRTGSAAGDIRINTNAFYAAVGGDKGAYWNADTFNNDQYAQFVHAAVFASGFRGISVRTSSSANTCYLFHGAANAGEMEVAKIVTGTFTPLDTGTGQAAVSDLFKLSVSSSAPNVLTPLQNGSTPAGITATVTETNASLLSGSAGLTVGGSTASARGDDWEGGNVSSGPGAGADSLTMGESDVVRPVSVTLSIAESG